MNTTQWVVERTFSSIKCWFGSGKAHYKRLARVHAQNLMEMLWHIICFVPWYNYALFITI
ncbi:MAG: transposase [Flavobacteriales bacterium Tduv]